MQAVHRAQAATVRDQIVRGVANPGAFRAALETIPKADRDAWLDLVCELGELPDDEPQLPPGCVPYLPCPVATLRDAIEHARLRADDVFVDIGAGLGRVSALVHLLTGAGCIGIEIQPGLVRRARGLCARLSLPRVTILEGDAVALVGRVRSGTVFFLYCPFSGERLLRVLGELEALASTRPIRVCCVDLPLPPLGWLDPIASPSPELVVYGSKPMRSR